MRKTRTKYRPPTFPRSTGRSRRHVSGNRRRRTIGPVRIEIIAAIVGAAVALLFSGVLGPDPFQEVRHTVSDRVRTLWESDAETVVREYVRDVEKSNFWRSSPIIFRESEAYFQRHFSALDPRVAHDFDELPKPVKTMSPADLVPKVNLFTAQHVGLVGIISAEPIQPEPNVWNLQIQWPRSDGSAANNSAVYLRVTTSPDESFEEGDVVAVNGVALATGEALLLRGAGYLEVVFLAASAIEKFPPDEFNKCVRQAAKTSSRDISPCLSKPRG
jgi:hypothetical protein